MIINLYEETVSLLERYGKTEKDIRWIGTSEYKIEFQSLKYIFDFDYDNGFGLCQINYELVVVGDDWWLERHEYDGSEWWEFKALPKMPSRIKPKNEALINRLF